MDITYLELRSFNLLRQEAKRYIQNFPIINASVSYIKNFYRYPVQFITFTYDNLVKNRIVYHGFASIPDYRLTPSKKKLPLFYNKKLLHRKREFPEPCKECLFVWNSLIIEVFIKGFELRTSMTKLLGCIDIYKEALPYLNGKYLRGFEQQICYQPEKTIELLWKWTTLQEYSYKTRRTLPRI